MFTSVNEFFLMRCVGEAVNRYKCGLFIDFFLFCRDFEYVTTVSFQILTYSNY